MTDHAQPAQDRPRPEPGPKTSPIVACLDLSAYAPSVCDHVAWFAASQDAPVELLHVVDTAAAAPPPRRLARMLRAAQARLRDESGIHATRIQRAGDFADVVASRRPQLVVMGKRGDTDERLRLGEQVSAMLDLASAPVCFASKWFLPISRGLVLLDDDPLQMAALDFISDQPRLRGLPMDFVVVASAGRDPQPKLARVRDAVGSEGGAVFALEAAGLDEAAARYIEDRGADIVVMSRPVLLRNPQVRGPRIAERGVWRLRTPVVVC